ncbi:hypothetical protein V6N11_056624 [Hibiscus sabdariffa]|uniref:Pentatricopeptide repeat-containing protein n=1 Tax=Hibiscus sabdariffa TaxID=183260 RepID=A0ABR2T4F3_9ROSI
MRRPLNSLVESSANAFYKVLTTHCRALKSGTLADVHTANKILNSYARCKDLHIARKVFAEIPHRDTVSWNTMIAGFVNCGNLGTACEILKDMKRCGFDFDGYTFGSLLKGVASSYRLEVGQQLHSMVIKMGYEGNVYAGSALLDMYAKCEKVDDAYMVFDYAPEPNSVSWNALIAGFSQVGDRSTAFWLLHCMEKEGVRVEDGTFAPLLTLLDDIEFYKLAIQIHGKIIKHGLVFDDTVCNAMITSYSDCGSIGDARKVFDGAVGMRDLVTWNSMLAVYLVHEEEELGFQLFLDMQRLGFEPDIYTYTSVLSACFEKAHKSHGQSLHGVVIKRGMECLIGLSEDALKLFGQMRSLTVEIDHYAFSAALRSCTVLATLQLGQQVHVLAIKSGFESNEFVASALIFMYSKCGMVEDARKSFAETPEDSSIAWNSIIFSYAQNGQGTIALDLFFLMRDRKVKLDHITFVAVLTACSHIGLVEEGLSLLKSMESDYGIPPRMEHYACAVDLLGRAGRLDEARTLIESMPFKPDAMVWKTLLGASRACGDIELATQVASYLLELEPEEHCTYVLLSHLYGHLRRWDEKAMLTRLMRERGVKKVPGWSWIEIKNRVHAFNAEDRSHPRCKEIYQILGELMEETTWLDTGRTLELQVDPPLLSCFALISSLEIMQHALRGREGMPEFGSKC